MQDSNPLDLEQRTRLTYVKIAREWSQQHDTQGFWNSELNYFQKILPEGKIFEIGCGGGRDAREFVQRGYSYFGTDVIPEFIEIAKRNVPEGEYEIQDVFHLKITVNISMVFGAPQYCSMCRKQKFTPHCNL